MLTVRLHNLSHLLLEKRQRKPVTGEELSLMVKLLFPVQEQRVLIQPMRRLTMLTNTVVVTEPTIPVR